MKRNGTNKVIAVGIEDLQAKLDEALVVITRVASIVDRGDRSRDRDLPDDRALRRRRDPVCAIAHGCATVQKSDYAKLAGVPVAVLGLLGYVGILVSLLRDTETWRTVTAFLSIVGLGFSGWLTYVEVGELERDLHLVRRRRRSAWRCSPGSRSRGLLRSPLPELARCADHERGPGQQQCERRDRRRGRRLPERDRGDDRRQRDREQRRQRHDRRADRAQHEVEQRVPEQLAEARSAPRSAPSRRRRSRPAATPPTRHTTSSSAPQTP